MVELFSPECVVSITFYEKLGICKKFIGEYASYSE